MDSTPVAAAPPERARKDPAAQLAAPHIARELRTVTAMLRIHCADRHAERPRDAADGLCAECRTLRDYARRRLALCTYGVDKPTCANCRIHCYGPKPREAIRDVMRHAGPRMIWHHPWLAAMHLMVDGRRPAPPRPNER